MKKIFLICCCLTIMAAMQAQISNSLINNSKSKNVNSNASSIQDLVKKNKSTDVYIPFYSSDSISKEYSANFNFSSNDQLVQEGSGVLKGQYLEPPDISVTPQSISSVLYSGKTNNKTFAISNIGEGNLNFTISPGESNQNYALEFDGIDDYVNLGNNINIANSSFTLEAWAKEGFATGERYLCGQGQGYTNTGLNAGFRNTNVFTFAFYNDDLDTQLGYRDLGWHHWACTFDVSTRARKIYRDGIEVATDAAWANCQSSGTFYIGMCQWGNNFKGCIDDVRIWNVVRTKEAIQQNWKRELSGNEPGLLGYWNFDEGYGSTVYDKSQNGNNGSLKNGVTWSNDFAPMAPAWLSVSQEAGSIPAHSYLDIDAVFNASYLSGGDYHANISVYSNDPDEPEVLIPVSLQVINDPSIHPKQDTLDFGKVFNGFTDTIELLVENTGSMDLLITGITTSPEIFSAYPGYAAIDPGKSEKFNVIFSPVDVGEYSGVLTFTSNDPQLKEYSVVLKGQCLEPPEISVTPQSLSTVSYSGKTTSKSFTISNTGKSNLNFTISPSESNQNYALEFDGIDDYVNLGNNINIANSSFTLEAWAKGESTNEDDYIWGQGEGYSNTGLHVGFRGSNVFTFAFYTNDLDTPLGYRDLAWHHWACTFDVSTKARKIYRDGIEVATDAAWANCQSSGPFYVGKCQWGSNFHGYIDDIRIWNIVRSKEDIQQNMGRKLLGDEPGLLGYWNFDEGNGLTVYDKSLNGNNGSLINGVSWTNELVPMVPGWISVNKGSGSIPANSSMDIDAVFNASYLTGGDYHSNITIYSNDPIEPEVLLPVSLQVNDVPSIHVKNDTLDFGEVFNGFADTLVLLVENTGSMDLLIFNAKTEPTEYSVSPPYAGINPGEKEKFIITFLPAVVGNYPGTLVFNCNDPVLKEYVITLAGKGIEPPIISFTPDSLFVEISVGQTTTENFTIKNSGGSNLNFIITPGESSQNYALEFDGIDDYLVIPNDESLQLPNSFTVEAWGYLKTNYPSGYDCIPIIWRGNYIGWGNDYHFRIAIRNNGIITPASGGQDGLEYLCDGGMITTNQWYHFAYVSDGDSLFAYLDGVLVASRLGNPPYMVSGYKTYLGWANPMGYSVYTDGIIDDVRFWSIARSQKDIENYMFTELTGDEPGLAGYWDFDEGTGLNVYDKSPNGNNGSLINGVKWSDVSAPTSPAWLSVSQETGIIPVNSNHGIDVFFNAEELDLGDYTAKITIASNDPNSPFISIPVHMIVSSGVGIENPEASNWQSALRSNPNPFQGSTTLEYELVNDGMVTLTIFNSYGQPIDLPVNEFQQNGEQKVNWNAEGLPAGIYYCRLLAGGQTKSVKIVKMK